MQEEQIKRYQFCRLVIPGKEMQGGNQIGRTNKKTARRWNGGTARKESSDRKSERLSLCLSASSKIGLAAGHWKEADLDD
jgi:ribosomal protein L28